MTKAKPKKVDWKKVGARLRDARQRILGDGLRGAGETMGVNYHTLWRIENGSTPNADDFLKVCAGLKLDPFALTGITPPAD